MVRRTRFSPMRKTETSAIFEAMQATSPGLKDLDLRSREIFRHIVDSYLATGEPVGSRNISRALPINLSPASVRNVMSDLESLGLIYSPHTSAGRLPTESGLRLFVDGLLEVTDVAAADRVQIEKHLTQEFREKSVEAALTELGERLSGLSRCAGVVLTDKFVTRIKHIEFVKLEPEKALVVLVGDDGSVENRIIPIDSGLPPSALTQASNYLNAHISGKTFADAVHLAKADIEAREAELDKLTARLIKDGLAVWSGGQGSDKSLIVRGRSNLLDDLTALDDLERIRTLFDDLEAKKDLIRLLGSAEQAEGVKIFIGSENKLFSLTGSSLIVSPFHDSERQIVGVLGVIGPTRLNYARIIPMVDYTAKLVGRMLGPVGS